MTMRPTQQEIDAIDDRIAAEETRQMAEEHECDTGHETRETIDDDGVHIGYECETCDWSLWFRGGRFD